MFDITFVYIVWIHVYNMFHIVLRALVTIQNLNTIVLISNRDSTQPISLPNVIPHLIGRRNATEIIDTLELGHRVLHILDVPSLAGVFSTVKRWDKIIQHDQTVLVVVRSTKPADNRHLARLFGRIRQNICYLRMIFAYQPGDTTLHVHQFDEFDRATTLIWHQNQTTSALLQFLRHAHLMLNFHRHPFNVKLNVNLMTVFWQQRGPILTGRDVWLAQLLADRLNASLHVVVPLKYEFSITGRERNSRESR